MQRRQIRVACCLLLVGTSALAETKPRFDVSSQRVVEALAAAGVSATTGQVRFLDPVTALVREPRLQVVRVGNWTGGALKAELRCRDHRACLPFYVLLGSGGTADAQGGTPQKGVTESLDKSALMRDGDPATLLFEGSTLRISMPVICLQSGNRGQTIRVASTDHKRFFSAEIIGAGLLKAAL
jgi:hypothetical protein